MTITELVNKAHENAKDKGFWDKPREVGTLIALLHKIICYCWRRAWMRSRTGIGTG